MTLALYTDPEGADLTLGIALLEQAGLEVAVETLGSEQDVIAAVKRLQPVALLVSYLPITEAVFRAGPSVGIVSCGSVGVDSVDLEAAGRHGVSVCNVPDAATEEVATHALAMALALVRHLPLLDRHVRDGGWLYDATGVPRRLSTMTVGVIGMGRIGRAFAKAASPLFRRIVAHDPFGGENWPENVERLGLDECLGASDVLSLHLPLTSATERLVDARAIGLMPRGAYLINVSRGRLVDTRAVLEALDDGSLAGAAFDVTDPEPPPADDRLRRHDRMIVTPHAAFYSAEALEAYVVRQAEGVVDWLKGGTPRSAVVMGRPAAASAEGRRTEGGSGATVRET